MLESWPIRKLQIELINLCNYKCPLCRTLLDDGVKRGRMEFAHFPSLIEPIKEDLSWIAFYGTRGEPLLHKALHNFISYATKFTDARTVVSTNASLLNPEKSQQILDAGLSEIYFAVDGLDQKSYETYRKGGNFESVISNIRQFNELKIKGNYSTKSFLQFIPMSSNEAHYSQLESFAKDLMVDHVRVKISSSVFKDDSFRPVNERFHPKTLSSDCFMCPSGFDFLYVDPLGKAFPCCYAEGYEEMYLGNVFEQSLSEIWNCDKMWALRTSFADQENFFPFCLSNCKNQPRKNAKIIS